MLICHKNNQTIDKLLFFYAKWFFFFRTFFLKCKFDIIWNWFEAKIILISPKYFWRGYSKWYQINQSAPGWNRGLPKRSSWPTSPNHVKFMEECTIWTENYILESESKRQTMESKQTDSPVNEKFRVQQSVKKVMLIVFKDMKGPITIDFLEKVATVKQYFWSPIPNAIFYLNLFYDLRTSKQMFKSRCKRNPLLFNAISYFNSLLFIYIVMKHCTRPRAG